MDQSRAEQRAVAIAKLKRAASLPRMKDGRRPPMHVEAFSEGEKMQAEEHKEEEGAVVQNGESSVQLDLLSVDPPPSSAVATGELEEQEESTPPEPDPENEIEPEAEPDAEFEPSPAKKKRRSRSRSRSRGSKDLRSRPKAIPSPAPNNATLYANESSADEGRPQSPFIVPPQLISPVPSYFAQLPTAALSRSAESPFLYPGTSPSTPLPSLEALQRGLFRSNSTNMTHRMLAMHKLTGGTEPLESFTSPSPPPPLSAGRLNRNNTVTGGERSAARRLMLNRIGERLKETDAELTSGGEDAATPVSPRRRKRRSHSRRSASRASTVVDDRDLSSTTPNTPAVVPAPLGPSSLDNMPDPPRPPSSRSNHSLGLQVSTLDQNLDDVDTPTEEVKTPVQSTRPRRSVVVEDEDDHFSPPRPAFMGLPATPRRSQGVVRVAHTSDAPSTISSDSAVGVPVFLSGKTVSGVDLFPSSPFHTPLREKVSHDDDDEEVLYEPEIGATRWANRVTNDREVSWVAQSIPESRPYTDIYDREISWAAEPVPESRMPIHDDEDDEDKEDEEPTWDERQPPDTLSSPADANYRVSTGSRELVVELDTSAEPTPSYLPPSPLATTALQISGTPSHSVRDESTSSPTCSPGDFFPPAPPSLPYPSHHHKELPDTPTHHIDLAGLEEAHITSKRSADGGMWDKFKRPFTRTGSISGRRSRTNSVSTRENRRDNTDSSVSRESGASQTSARLDKGENGVFAQQQAQPASVMQSPSASGSFLSLAPQAPPRNGVSPVPPASSADMAKYMDAKLFPFPGMKKLEEERNRARGMSASVSSPDIISPSFSQGLSVDQITPSSSSSSTQPARSPELAKDRKLYHQASDSRLISKFNGTLASPPISQAPSASSNHEYTKTTPARSLSHQPSSSKLPTTREGVKKWLKDKLVFSSQPTTSLPLNSAQYSPPAYEPKFAVATKPSISDLLRGRRENEFASDADDAAQSRTDSNTSTLQGQAIEAGYMTVNVRPLLTDPTKAVVRSGSGRDVPVFSTLSDLQSVSSPPDAPSTTPEPFSSVDEYPTRTTSESSSAFSSNAPSSPREEFNSQGAVVLERLDEMLGRGPRSPMWANVTDEPPRKLIQSSAVLQVANSNTVKDRFLFLFNDILVIAKPIMRDQDALRDPMSSAALDRKFIVKSVVQLQKLQFNADRDDPPLRGTLDANQPRHPIIRSFVYQFAKDPHQAIASLFDRLGTRDDAMALGQLLFRTLDLDRARLGEYLSQRTSKMVLKSYVDSFGFAGLRVDKALRAFLMSIHFPPKQSQVEYLVDAFASRWYEANAGIVAYSKDLAIRLVRAVVHLNEVLHGGISQEPGATQYPHRNVTSRDFMDAFRRTRSLLPDDLLERIYSSIRRERLCQSRNPASGTPDIPISTKRPLPSRLTYRVQSDPIIVRIPQPDPDLQITLHGQDLTFDPSVLNFSKLSEASFRVTGTSLGPKTIIMCRSGPNSLKYWGLPLGSTVMVERAFMRNTFQIAFMNHEREKRKYMFSVEDPVWRHQWISSLKHHIETARQAAQGNSDSSGPSKFHRATEKVALRVLQETLIGPSDPPTRPSTSNVDKALRGFVSSSSPQHMLNGGLSPGSLDSSRRSGLYSHARSKSRSQIYHKYGAGKFEIELGNESSSSALEQSQDEQDDDSTAVQPRCRLWSGQELTMMCQKNSSIPLVLSFLQIGSPEAMSTRPPGDVWPVAAG